MVRSNHYAAYTVPAAVIPQQYLGIMMNSGPEGRDSGLLVTHEDIVKIKRYEHSAMRLPADTDRLGQEVGVGETGIRGLELVDILALYDDIRLHAYSWAGLESRIKLLSVQLGIFAGKFTTAGDHLLKFVDSMEILEQIGKTIADVTPEDLANWAGKPLSEVDRRLKGGMALMLALMKDDVHKQREYAQKAKDGCSVFVRRITEALIPGVTRKMQLARDHNLQAQVEVMDREIKQLDVDIAAKKAEYDTLVKQSLKSAAKFPFGLVNAGIYGAAAERARKEKNRLVDRRQALIERVAILVPVIGAVDRLSATLSDMEFRLTDAQEGASNLHDMWMLMHAYIETSATAFDAITDDKSLLMFAVEFRIVLQPWAEIGEDAQAFALLFNQAVNNWQQSAVA